MNIGKVTVRQATRTTIADPKFQPKPNVALTELADTNITVLEDGQVVTYSSVDGKFITKDLGNIAPTPSKINGGSF